jgi:hypothetical protein
MSQHVLTPLLVDSRLTLPALESSKIAVLGTAMLGAGALGLAKMAPRMAGKAVGLAKSIPTRMANSSMQNAADFKANAGAMAVPKLTPEAANAAAAAKLAPPAVAAPKPAGSPGLSNTLANLSGTRAMGMGALAGGLKGIVDPGTTTDENGNQVQKSRIGAAIGGAATGATAGALAAPLVRAGARAHAAGALSMPGAKEAIPAVAGAAPAAVPVHSTTGAELPPMPTPPKFASVTLGIPTLPFTKKADRIIKHEGSPGPRGTSSDATYNRANGGAACTNTDAVTSNSKLASAADSLGAGYNKAQGAPLSGPANMDKGPDGAKAETTDHDKRVALAKQETDGSKGDHTAPTHGIPSSAVDKEKAVAAFPVLNNRK